MNSRNLIRWAGLAALVAGILFVVIQGIHPPDALASVTTARWAIVHALTFAMCLLLLLGITGIYARQVSEAGWLGLAGYLLFGLAWAIQAPYGFIEALVLPHLATHAPTFVESWMGMFNGHPGAINLGALATVYQVAGLLYILGGLLFGIATLRAGVLPRRAAGLLAVAAALTPTAALLSHPLDRILALPTGLALAWLGYALWSSGGRTPQSPRPAGEAPSSIQPRSSKVAG